MPQTKKQWLILLISLITPLLIGLLAGELVLGNFKTVYNSLNLPPFAPYGIIFSLVWSVLYLLMGLSAYFIAKSPSKEKDQALFVFGLLMIFLFLWPLFFFNLRFFTFSAFLLGIIIILSLSVYYNFKNISPKAAYILSPYLIWLLFAFYLNIGIIFLN